MLSREVLEVDYWATAKELPLIIIIIIITLFL